MKTTTWLSKHLAIINQFWLVMSSNRFNKVIVCWGKSKKTYNAQVISLSSVQAPASPAATRMCRKKQFCFQVVNPAPSTPDCRDLKDSKKKDFPLSYWCAVSGLRREVSVLQSPTDYPLLPATPMPLPTMEMAILRPPYLQETLQTHLESPQPLSDVTTQLNETDFCMANGKYVAELINR